MGGRSKREGIQVYIQLVHFIVQQKLTQHCKATILQWKKKNETENSEPQRLYLLLKTKNKKNPS